MFLLTAVAFVILALGCYLGWSTPRIVQISRSQVIHASPESIFPHITNAQLIQTWNPFMDGDSSVNIQYSGPAEGLNAKWRWDGKKSGAGEATIIRSEQNKRVALRLDFKKPFHVTNYGEYAISEKGGAAEITWTIDESALFPRMLSRFVNLDKLIGGHFERGLTKLKVLVEANNQITN